MDAKWSGGYVADIPYLPTYLSAQAPAEMEVVCALSGVRFGLPREGLTYLDLGCGRGVGVLAMAAANPSWTCIGIDYMPAHVGEARDVATEAGLDNARFLEADIAAIDEAEAARLLPELDVVTMHGVWTWVSDPVREGILRILRSRLKPGGLVLVSYNAMPGWADDLPVQRLLRELVGVLDGSRTERMLQAIDLAREMQAAGAPALQDSFFLGQIAASQQFSREALARYAIHEFLSEHWRPAFAQDVAAAFLEAKLDYVGPASLALHFAEVTLSPEQREARAALPRNINAEFTRDLFAAPSLRVDLFVRGRRPADAMSAVLDLPLALRLLPEDRRVVLEMPNGNAELPERVIGAALDALSRGPQRLGELAALPEMARTTPGELLAVLAGSHVAAPVWRAEVPAAAQARANRFNAVLLERLGADAMMMGGDLAIAAPMLGGGLPSKPMEVAALLAMQEAEAKGEPLPGPEALARGMLVAEAPEATVNGTIAGIRRALLQRLPAWRGLGLVAPA